MPTSAPITGPALARRLSTRFMGVEVEVPPGVLVPREETELLGYATFAVLRDRPRPATVVDLCCGAGNLACAIAVAFPDARVVACDLTDEAVAAAAKNVARLGLQERVTVGQGDLFAPLDASLAGQVDLVVCNPPHISTARLAAETAPLLEAEPREAFDGGPYGLSLHQRIVAEAPAFLKPDGWLAMEFGEGRSRQIEILFRRAQAYAAPEFLRDERGIPRAVRSRRQPRIAVPAARQRDAVPS
ncbi:HemK family protein methyltransferase [uncultured Methylobacterium sp.]|uniref:N5-glutamine methyltransferase family protein n=1 Tax=uncultured Methylobacterium sp. TaxID=157278 RepID=UPI00260CD794|nr:HemK family protein methyltransferase [uncultured Methylobacterium sp.]